MNLILLQPDDFLTESRVRLHGRRLQHVRDVHRAAVGDELRVGAINGKLGVGRVEQLTIDVLEMTVRLDADPPAPLPVRLVLALPRPKVLNRTIAAAVSMGIREIDLINAWRVEKSYWTSPNLAAENLRLQATLGLEQAGDTIMPSILLHRLFTPFVREELSQAIDGRLSMVAHPRAAAASPRQVTQPVVLAIGPEGGFIEREVETFKEIGFTPVTLGPRILRVETALPYLIGRLFD